MKPFVIQSDRLKFHRFYLEWAPLVRSIVFRLSGSNDLDDLTQEVFLKAWLSRESFQGRSSEKTWIYRIAFNTTIDFLRKKKSNNELNDQLALQALVQTPTTNPELPPISEAIAQLSEDEKSVIVLFYYQDLSIQEIAEILEAPEGTIKSRLFSAKKNLADRLKRKEKIYAQQ